MTNKGGNLVTRLLGRLVIKHNMGTVEFELRNSTEIRRRGARVIVKIHGLGEIPRLEDGMTIEINGTFVDLDNFITFRKNHDSEDISPDRRRDVS